MVLGRTSPRMFDRAEGQWFRGLGASGIRTGTSARTGQENCAEVCYPGVTGYAVQAVLTRGSVCGGWAAQLRQPAL